MRPSNRHVRSGAKLLIIRKSNFSNIPFVRKNATCRCNEAFLIIVKNWYLCGKMTTIMKRLLLFSLFIGTTVAAMGYTDPQPQGLESETIYYSTVPDHRNLYTYNGQGLVSVKERQNYTTESGFSNSAKYEYKYSQDNRISNQVYYSYNSSKSAYEPRRQNIYSYDTAGRLVSYLVQTRKPGYNWTNDTKSEYTYNGNGQTLTEKNYQKFNSYLALYQEIVNTYSSNGVLIEKFGRYANNGWDSVWTTYSYNEAGYCKEEKQYADSLHKECVESLSYTYDSAGRITKEDRYSNVGASGQLIHYSTCTYSYNTHGDMTSESMKWHVTYDGSGYKNEDWSYTFSYEYDKYGRMTKYSFNAGDTGYILYEYADKNPTSVKGIDNSTPSVGKVMKDGRLIISTPGGDFTMGGTRLN